MVGRAPVDSPTSIISTANSGKKLVSSRLPESEPPSRTRRAASSTVLEILRLLIELLAVSKDGTRGMPPASNVASVREHRNLVLHPNIAKDRQLVAHDVH